MVIKWRTERDIQHTKKCYTTRKNVWQWLERRRNFTGEDKMAYRRKFRKSGKILKLKFQSFVDINTDPNNMQVINFKAGGSNVLKRLAPQFGAYKYYKLGGISIKGIAASTLPVDPTGLSMSDSEATVDPRDQLTPGMCRITNGENIDYGAIAGLSAEEQHQFYNNMLLDPRWYKWMLQSGFKRYAKPKLWNVAMTEQYPFPGSVINIPGLAQTTNTVAANGVTQNAQPWDVWGKGTTNGQSNGKSLFQTGHTERLGWMPTSGLYDDLRGNVVPHSAQIPEIDCVTVILPKAYKTKYYYRVFITETVYFKQPLTNILPDGYRPLDVFNSVRVYNARPTSKVNGSDTNPNNNGTV